jgi:hypothetical protein
VSCCVSLPGLSFAALNPFSTDVTYVEVLPEFNSHAVCSMGPDVYTMSASHNKPMASTHYVGIDGTSHFSSDLKCHNFRS